MMPVPTGGASAPPGALALLLPWIRLSSMIVHDRVALPGQRPSCGEGASSLFIEFGATPARLSRNTELRMTSCPPELVHDRVALPGQRPSCGEGASSLFIEFGATPARLSRNTELRMTSCPPEFVPEYPSAELTPASFASVVSQTRRHAPT